MAEATDVWDALTNGWYRRLTKAGEDEESVRGKLSSSDTHIYLLR